MSERQTFNIFSNVEIYFTFACAILALGVSAFGGHEIFVDGLISLILTSLAMALLKDRKNMKQLKLSIDNISKNSINTIDYQRDYRAEVRSLISDSKNNISILLRTASIISEQKDEFEDALKKGCTIRVLSCNKNDRKVIKSILLESASSIDEVENKFKSGYDAAMNLSKRYPGSFFIKYTEYMPSSLMYLIDCNDSQGKGYIIPFSYKRSPRESPSIHVTYAHHGDILQYYNMQYDDLWDDGVSYDESG